MIIPVYCIHETPSDVCDIVDIDYLCPIIVYCSQVIKEEKWTFPKPHHILVYKTDGYDFYMELTTPDEVDERKARGGVFHLRYDTSYHVIFKQESNVSDDQIAEAIDIINRYKCKTVESMSLSDQHEFLYFPEPEMAKTYAMNNPDKVLRDAVTDRERISIHLR